MKKNEEQTKNKLWLKIKKNHISGTDAGIIMNASPHCSPYRLFQNKMHDGDSIAGNEARKEIRDWGRRLEQSVADYFAEISGYKLFKRGMMQDNYCLYRIANVDRLIANECAGVECKTTSAYNREAWANGGYPLSYYYQCLHYMLVMFCKADGTLMKEFQNKNARWYLVCLIGGNHTEIREIRYNEDDAVELAKKEKEFFEKMQNNICPSVSDKECDADYWKRQESKKFTAISLNDNCDKYAGRLFSINTQLKALKKEKQLCENYLFDKMTENAHGVSDRYYIDMKDNASREIISINDVKMFPEIYRDLENHGLIRKTTPTRTLKIKMKDGAI